MVAAVSRLRALVFASLLATVAGAGCRPKPTAAPYAPGKGPNAEVLIAGARPQLDAIAVADAKVVANRVMRGNLALLAQAPGRFRGSVQVSGNELVTLAFTEDGYALRYKLDAFPTGFYHGPPSACAVEALLGVALDTEALVALVLGGAPVIGAPYEVAEQGWDPASARETVTIRNGRYVQRLEFAPVGEGWQFAGSKLWVRNADGTRGAWRWTLSHEGIERHGDVLLPARTRVLAPGKRRDNQIVIEYRSRDLDPAFAKRSDEVGGDEGGGADDWGSADDAWESTDAGEWEGGSAEPAPTDGAPTEPETPAAGDAPAGPAPQESGGGATPGPQPESRAPDRDAPPAVFTIQSTGLRDRGDLCR